MRRRPKTYFLRPDVVLPLGVALLRELWQQKVVGRPDAYVMPAHVKTANGKVAANSKSA